MAIYPNHSVGHRSGLRLGVTNLGRTANGEYRSDMHVVGAHVSYEF